MEKDERITRLISEMMGDYRKNQAAYYAQIEKGKQLASMMLFNIEMLMKAEDGKQVMYEVMLQEVASEFIEWYEDQKTANANNLKQWIEDIKPIMEVMRQYQRFIDSYNSSQEEARKKEIKEPTEDILNIPKEISEEISEIINSPNKSNNTAIEYNPLMTRTTNIAARESKEQVIQFSNRKGANRSMTLKKGHLSVYDSFVLNLVVREYRLGNVTSEKEVVFILDDICRAMTGRKGTPSQKQRNDVKEALERIRTTVFSFITSEELAAIIGIEATEISNRLTGFKYLKDNELKLHETHLINKLDMITRFKRRGKQTTVAILTFGDIFQSLLENFKWYQEIDESINNIQIEKNGELHNMAVTKERLTMQYYIHRKVFSKIRANISGRAHSNKINYDILFAECEIDVKKAEQKKRRVETVKLIFSDLKRKGYIVNFSEYSTGTEKAAGIKYTTPKFEAVEIEE